MLKSRMIRSFINHAVTNTINTQKKFFFKKNIYADFQPFFSQSIITINLLDHIEQEQFLVLFFSLYPEQYIEKFFLSDNTAIEINFKLGKLSELEEVYKIKKLAFSFDDLKPYSINNNIEIEFFTMQNDKKINLNKLSLDEVGQLLSKYKTSFMHYMLKKNYDENNMLFFEHLQNIFFKNCDQNSYHDKELDLYVSLKKHLNHTCPIKQIIEEYLIKKNKEEEKNLKQQDMEIILLEDELKSALVINDQEDKQELIKLFNQYYKQDIYKIPENELKNINTIIKNQLEEFYNQLQDSKEKQIIMDILCDIKLITEKYIKNNTNNTDILNDICSTMPTKNRLVKEYNDLLKERDDLLKKRDDLLKKCDNLLKKCDDLLKKGDDLSKKHDDLLKKGDDLLKERNDILKKHDNLLKKHDDLFKEYDDSLKKHDDLLKKGDDLSKKHDDLLKKGDDLLKERNDILKKHDNLLKKHDNLLKERNDILKERDDLLKEYDHPACKIIFKESNDSLYKSILKKHDDLFKEHNDLLKKHDDLSYDLFKEYDDSLKKCDDSLKKCNDSLKKYDDLFKKYDDLLKDYQHTTIDINNQIPKLFQNLSIKIENQLENLHKIIYNQFQILDITSNDTLNNFYQNNRNEFDNIKNNAFYEFNIVDENLDSIKNKIESYYTKVHAFYEDNKHIFALSYSHNNKKYSIDDINNEYKENFLCFYDEYIKKIKQCKNALEIFLQTINNQIECTNIWQEKFISILEKKQLILNSEAKANFEAKELKIFDQLISAYNEKIISDHEKQQKEQYQKLKEEFVIIN